MINVISLSGGKDSTELYGLEQIFIAHKKV